MSKRIGSQRIKTLLKRDIMYGLLLGIILRVSYISLPDKITFALSINILFLIPLCLGGLPLVLESRP